MTLFAFGIVSTILTSAYILWMIKRIFFGKLPEELVHVKDSSRYITVTMAVFAALSLAIGVYPDAFFNPISGYVQGMFADYPGVLPVPESSGIIEPVAHAAEAGADSVAIEEGIETGGGH